MVMGEATIETQVAVIGAGPGGYAAAFRAADLGLEVTMIDRDARPGGVCLYRGCIPSKALLHVVDLIKDTRQAGEIGLHFQDPEIDLNGIRKWKDGVVDRLGDGLVSLSEARDVQLLQGRAEFEDAHTLRVTGTQTTRVEFEHAILATGSTPISLPGTEFAEGSRLMSSTQALELPEIPEKLLVVGAGYVGLGLGSIYAALGSRVTLVEMLDGILPMVDRDLVRPLARKVGESFEAIYLDTKVSDIDIHEESVDVRLEGDVDEELQTFDRVLVAVGRYPNSRNVGLENTAVEQDDDGFVQVDEQQRTAENSIFAIGDVVGGNMLAHKAMYEGKIAAEVIAGEASAFDARAVPAVVYTDPAIAWTGLMEEEARKRGMDVRVARFPWQASGRALTMQAADGLTKMVLDAESDRILGLGIVGRRAGELIPEGVLAIEMGAVADDLAMTIYPHPSLSETIEEAAEAALGHPTHIAPPEKAA